MQTSSKQMQIAPGPAQTIRQFSKGRHFFTAAEVLEKGKQRGIVRLVVNLPMNRFAAEQATTRSLHGKWKPDLAGRTVAERQVLQDKGLSTAHIDRRFPNLLTVRQFVLKMEEQWMAARKRKLVLSGGSAIVGAVSMYSAIFKGIAGNAAYGTVAFVIAVAYWAYETAKKQHPALTRAVAVAHEYEQRKRET